MWRAECGGDCMEPTFTRFTRDEALGAWNAAMSAKEQK
jgi:hypothetical protein